MNLRPTERPVWVIEKVARDLAGEAGGKFAFSSVNVEDPSSGVSQESLYESFGLRPIAYSLFGPEYYLHIVLQIEDKVQMLYPSGALSEADIRTEIEASLKRSVPGFLKTVGVWFPSEEPMPNPYGGQPTPPLATWNMIRNQLGQDYTLRTIDLSTGRIPGNGRKVAEIGAGRALHSAAGGGTEAGHTRA